MLSFKFSQYIEILLNIEIKTVERYSNTIYEEPADKIVFLYIYSVCL